MTASPDFVFGYIPFWIVAYGTAVVAWSCVGRFMLELFLPPNSSNYILRWFHLLTQWAVVGVRVFTPALFHTRYLLLITAYWAFVVRFVLTTILLNYGLVPLVSKGAAP
ncbi:hypothetical protein [Magnetospirillum sp. UT-4]|uniref:hypothetical protein n=1 Tax=Magnetospirillum sp. UT-4 TaxID=2681467 RepID=UPI00137D1D51|nr:hypothetical protein [Magnetospirillum sp. UT-4]CAA7626427.1 membrane hypothetical protein [Magnetospirillum sp. UT-4]